MTFESVTADDIRELLESRAMEPTLIRLGDGSVEVVPGPYLRDVRAGAEVIFTAAELRSQGDWDIEHPSDEDLEAFAELANS